MRQWRCKDFFKCVCGGGGGGGGSTINWVLLNLHLDLLVISISEMRPVTDRTVNLTLYD